MMILADLPQREACRPKIYGLEPNGHKDGYVEFDHVDGAYSYCVAFSTKGKFLGLVHLAAWTPLVEHEDGYRVRKEDE